MTGEIIPFGKLPKEKPSLYELAAQIGRGQAEHGQLRIMPVLDVNMEPTLRMESLVAVVPADGFTGDGFYVMNAGVGPRIFRCSKGRKGWIDVRHDSPLSDVDYSVPRNIFGDWMIGRVVARVEFLPIGGAP
jgi:hypothetical protein